MFSSILKLYEDFILQIQIKLPGNESLKIEHFKVLTIFRISHEWISWRVLKYFQHTFETNCKSSTIKKIMEKCFTYI